MKESERLAASQRRAPPTKPVLGLIGGIGSGKSEVAEEFARRGAKIVSGDRLGHEALRQPDIRNKIVERWGQGILDKQGEIDRRKVGAIVFADDNERKALETLAFPYIEAGIRREIEVARNDPAVKLVVLDAAIMLEAGWNNVCDRIVYVDSPREQRLERLARQRGWSEKEVAAREKAQVNLSEKKARADVVLDNSGTREHTARQVEDLLKQWNW